MEISVEIWLRGEHHATTQVISEVGPEPRTWTDRDVRAVVAGMLRALDRAKNPDADPDRHIALRGFSWIVNAFESGGVVIAIELSVGAAVAGPFDITEAALSQMIQRVVDDERATLGGPSSATVH
jgi:hypothetical protein